MLPSGKTINSVGYTSHHSFGPIHIVLEHFRLYSLGFEHVGRHAGHLVHLYVGLSATLSNSRSATMSATLSATMANSMSAIFCCCQSPCRPPSRSPCLPPCRPPCSTPCQPPQCYLDAFCGLRETVRMEIRKYHGRIYGRRIDWGKC